MEVSKDYNFQHAIHSLEDGVDFSKEDTDYAVKTIFENSDLLNSLDPAALKKVKIKLLERGVSDKDKVINLIDRVYASYTGKIEAQINNLENELYFFKKLGELQPLSSNQYLRVYEHKITLAPSIEVNNDYIGPNILQFGFKTIYNVYDQPNEIINFINDMKFSLEVKINKLLSELKKEGMSADNLENGLVLLKNLDERLSGAIDGLKILQKTNLFKENYSNLVSLEYDISIFQNNVKNEIVQISGFAHMASQEDPDEEIKNAFRTFLTIQSQLTELEGDSFNSPDLLESSVSNQPQTEKSLKGFSRFLSEKSYLKVPKYELILEKINSEDDLSNLNENRILINGKISLHPPQEIGNLIGENIEIDPVCTLVIAKMISPKMFENLLNVAEDTSTSAQKDLVKLSELSRFVEINVDEFGELEIMLKVACGYSLNSDNNTDDIILAKRSFKISLSDLKLNLKAGIDPTAKDFEIVDFISPEVKASNYKFLATANLQKLSGVLLENFSPNLKSIPAHYKKILENEIEKNVDLSLAEVLGDLEFITCFEDTCALYGTQLNSEVVLILAKSWEDEKFRSLFKDFINAVKYSQQANREILNAGLLPTLTLEHNMTMMDLGITTEDYFSILETDKTKMMINFLIYLANHGFIKNQQAIEDLIGQEFASDYVTEGTSSRAYNYLTKVENLAQNLDEQISELTKTLDSESIDLSSEDYLEIKKQIAELIQLKEYAKEGYVKASQFPILIRNVWTPKISSVDDIQPVNRIMGFMTKEGKKLESISTLNLVGIIPNNPTIAQRVELSNLMKKCDSFIVQHSEFIKLLDSDFEIPSEIASMLEKMDWLNDDQKRELFIELIRFSFDVNYNFIVNSMNI